MSTQQTARRASLATGRSRVEANKADRAGWGKKPLIDHVVKQRARLGFRCAVKQWLDWAATRLQGQQETGSVSFFLVALMEESSESS